MSDDKTKRATCCAVDCNESAEWELRDGPRPDNYTHACDAHVGALLSRDRAALLSTVTRLAAEVAR